ncbi:unnamed protein product [Owenia fusiformis]|uniref:Uncharacterized protein n=1 Tax=Owenia fusiformis TaxID=6347 RepID=A0A8J1UDD2_OWEFU|nr:unnamed protein product [Owenia fusiformis]
MGPIFFILLTLIPTIVLCDDECSPDTDWKYYSATGKCYFFNTQDHSGGTGPWGLTWRGARNWCMANGGDLASIHSKEETDFILSVWPQDTDWWDWWIGLNELDLSGGYKWSDGSPLDYENWAKGEPNDWKGHELCSELRYARGRILKGQWNDQVCSFIRGFICKKNPRGRPPPATPRPIELPGNCPPTFVPFGNKCYNFVPMKKKWNDAQAYCYGLGAASSKEVNLASIADDVEQGYITSQLINKPYKYWIGMRQLERPSDRQKGKFYWIDNSDVTYTNWNRGEPNGGADPNLCVQIYNNAFRAGEWNDEWCTDSEFFICQTLKDVKYPQPPQLPNPCGSGNTAYGPGCYNLVSIPSTWQDAQTECRRQEGYDLVSITSQHEQGFIRALMKQNDMIYNAMPMWTGLTDRTDPGHYEWTNKWPVIYTNWGDGQPVKNSGGCVLVRPDDGRWYDTDCSTLAYGLCKKSDAKPPYTPKRYGQCPHTRDGDDWVGYDVSCYLFRPKESLSHGDAEVACQALDARLVSVHSDEETNFIVSRLAKTISYTCWVGLMKSLSRGYQWKDGSAVEYTNWGENQPSDVDGTQDKNCVQMWLSGKWSDVQCTASRGYICKRDQINVSKPPQGAAAAGIAIGVSIAVIALLTGLYFVWKKKFSGGIASYFDKKPQAEGFSPSDIAVPDKTTLSNA